MNSELFLPLKQEAQKARAIPEVSSRWTVFFASPFSIFALCLLTFLVIGAFIAPQLTTHLYSTTKLASKNLPPSSLYWFGSDELGRDIFSRVWLGTRVSLGIGFCAAIIDLLIGVSWGALSATLGGKVDAVMMSVTDVLYSLPQLLMAMVLTLVFGTGIIPIIVAIALFGWIPMARIVRAEVLRIKEYDFVLSAKAIGMGRLRVITRHIIPNISGPIAVSWAMNIPKAIYAEAFLGFLGLGVQPPLASLGTMAYESIGAALHYPWRFLFPACFLSLTIIAMNIIGDGLAKTFSRES